MTTIIRRDRPRPAVAAALPLTLLLVAAGGATAEESCRASVGPSRAAALVARCVAVSPATRPPCNASNPCALIEEEIARGCDDLDEEAPDFCLAYRHR
ncbi:hypothetical protein [Methylobacterium radiodurans]|uniref:Secreted protein n=1 Tax=Methylobacterium radiodurans TaxID=2202828 RepID=A0A2U8VVW7_9HYPH|nr:hypothetical protein [Methylobacterium radiodurans]AWN37256.1 hypothetical protein DK427_17245 [Methylobacterium radiodurans]